MLSEVDLADTKACHLLTSADFEDPAEFII